MYAKTIIPSVLIMTYAVFGVSFAEDILLLEHVVDGNVRGVAGLHAADIDDDGDMDIVGGAIEENAVFWWRNNGDDPITWTRFLVGGNFIQASSVYAARLDDDDRVDIAAVAREGDEVAWWRNNGGDPITWTRYTIREGYDFAHEIYADDLDEDGDMDLLGAASDLNCLTWWRNDGGNPPVWTEQVIATGFHGAKSIHVGYIDDDDRKDIIGAAIFDNEVAWWRNDGGDPAQWTKFVITYAFIGAHRVQAIDIDRDGRVDVAGAAYLGHEIAWWRNDGGSPIHWTKQTLETGFLNACNVFACDLDGDTDIDVLGTAQEGNEVAWWRNEGESPIQWTKFVLSDFTRVWPLHACDLDGDDDADVIAASGHRGINEVRWFENLGSEWLLPWFSADPLSGHAPLTIRFEDESNAYPPANSWFWDFDYDGTLDGEGPSVDWIFQSPGIFSVSLNVSNGTYSEQVTRNSLIRVFDGESALEFQGDSGVATCSDAPLLNLRDTLTMEAWIHPVGWGEVPGAGYGRVIDKDRVLLFLVGESGIYNDESLVLLMFHDAGGSSVSMTPTGSMHLDEWCHVAASYDASRNEVRMYLNGISQDVTYSRPPNGDLVDHAEYALRIGNSENESSSFRGSIDEVRIWGTVRSEAAIAGEMDEGLTGDEDGLLAYWRMNEGNGPTISDETPYGHTGVVSEAMWAEGIDLSLKAGESTDCHPVSPMLIVSDPSPNPFRNGTEISLDLRQRVRLLVEIFDIRGRLVRTVLDGDLSPGRHVVHWSGLDTEDEPAANGIYFLKITGGGSRSTRKLLFLP